MSVDPTLAVAPRGAAPLSPFSGPERPAERIIVALDGLQADEAVTMAEAIPDLRWVKVGLELFVSAGPEVVDRLRQAGLSVFLDLKLHDIPATMAGACRRAAGLGARLITVHACAGAEALAAAQAAALEGAQQAGLAAPVLLAVTVLTSWDPQRFRRELAIETPLEPYSLQLAGLAAGAGIAGAVCSPLEVAALRQAHPLPFQLVTPGIRPAGSTSGDQRRVLTPAEAVAAGASQLVIGRPITTAPDPAVAFAACCAELS